MGLDDVASSYERSSLRLVKSAKKAPMIHISDQARVFSPAYLSDMKRSLSYATFFGALSTLSWYGHASIDPHPVDDILLPIVTVGLGLAAAKKLYDASKSFMSYQRSK